ncbi:MAG: hypothetical protein ABL995_08735 [Bryobacteraceae bacterium]
MNLTALFVIFIAAFACTLGLAALRSWIARYQEDDNIHILDRDAHLVPQQVAVARRLRVLDAWGKAATVLAVGAGTALAAGHLYRAWNSH